MGLRTIETELINRIADPSTTVDDLRRVHTSMASKLTVKTLHCDVITEALKLKDVGVIDFLANEVGVTGGVRSTVMAKAFFCEVPDAALDALDRAFVCKTHRPTMDEFAWSLKSWHPNNVACFQRAHARYNATPTKSALSLLISKPTLSEFEEWLDVLLPLFKTDVLKTVEVDVFTLRCIFYKDVSNWEARLNKMEEVGFVLDTTVLRNSLRDIRDPAYVQFVNKRVRQRAAMRGKITKQRRALTNA